MTKTSKTMNGQEFNKIMNSLKYYCKKKHITEKVKAKIDQLKNVTPGSLSYIFELAFFNGNVELVRYLIESDIKPPDVEPLKFWVEKVCQYGQKEVAHLLIENGYPTNDLSIQRMMLGGHREGIFIVRKILREKCVCYDCLVKMVCVTPCDKIFKKKVSSFDFFYDFICRNVIRNKIQRQCKLHQNSMKYGG